jgi:hypothetical protein
MVLSTDVQDQDHKKDIKLIVLKFRAILTTYSSNGFSMPRFQPKVSPF